MWCFFFFFFNDTATTEIYTLSLHDALPILPFKFNDCSTFQEGLCSVGLNNKAGVIDKRGNVVIPFKFDLVDRKSTRLNSSHANISYAVFCLKKKKLPL